MSSASHQSRPESLRPLLAGVVVVFAALLAAASLKSYRDLTAERMREQALERRIEETQARIEHLRGRIQRLRDDPGTLERLARGDLGMVLPGDVVIELPRGDGEPREGAALEPGAAATGPATAAGSAVAAGSALPAGAEVAPAAAEVPLPGPGSPGSGAARAAVLPAAPPPPLPHG